MEKGFYSARNGVLSLALCSACCAQAQVQSATLAETVVTATRVAQPITDLVADVTILDRSTIDRSGATAVGDILARVPGMEMVRNGGAGSTTSVYIRGAETRFTAVYVDGVRIDSQSTGGATWEAIPLSQIERIEILRGPASSVYGSDAMGGAIQIFTRRVRERFRPLWPSVPALMAPQSWRLDRKSVV
jgi:vitamin B12 transporter